MTENRVLARVSPRHSPRGAYLNGILHAPGEQAWVDLDALGIKSLDDTKALEPGDPEAGTFVDQTVLAPARDASLVPPLSVAFDGTAAAAAAAAASELPEPEPAIRREEDADVRALVDANTKAQLLDLAAEEEVDGVSDDNNKSEIAEKIVTKRRAG